MLDCKLINTNLLYPQVIIRKDFLANQISVEGKSFASSHIQNKFCTEEICKQFHEHKQQALLWEKEAGRNIGKGKKSFLYVFSKHNKEKFHLNDLSWSEREFSCRNFMFFRKKRTSKVCKAFNVICRCLGSLEIVRFALHTTMNRFSRNVWRHSWLMQQFSMLFCSK